MTNYFDNVINGGSCASNWYEGCGTVHGDKIHFDQDAPGVLGFDDSIAWYCGSQQGGRRLDEEDEKRLPEAVAAIAGRLGSKANNESVAATQWIEEAPTEHERHHRRRLGEAARACVQANRNILMLFGGNVHNTGAGYNSCRNLEWQVCAALGRLPGQRTPTIIFARAPNSLDAEGERPLAHCGGYSPQGCGPYSYSNDDM